MKKIKVILTLIIGIALGALSAAGVYFATVGEIAWQEYIETKLMPNAVIVISAIGSLMVAALPIIGRVQNGLDKFNKATSDISDTAESGKLTSETLAGYKEMFDSFKNEITDAVLLMQSTVENTEKIVRLGFCNTDELVKKGYATEIQKVGKVNEKSED